MYPNGQITGFKNKDNVLLYFTKNMCTVDNEEVLQVDSVDLKSFTTMSELSDHGEVS
jgi:hypothetical protein